mmetsp:Transcript_2786/g.8191  ORF Transcript_2786/g.8191 Transcript_2786/m.8191 type:complete len:406 (+) Transcript_2786:189-1406(+)
MPLTQKQRKAAATAAAAAATYTCTSFAAAASAVSIATAAVAADDDLVNRNVPHKKGGRYLRGSALPDPEDAPWALVLKGDERELFEFLSLPNDSFNSLVSLLSEYIASRPLRVTSGEHKIGRPRPSDMSHRKFNPKDIVAMTLKFITTTSEVKDLALLFGACQSTYSNAICLGMKAMVVKMSDDERSRVYWDRSTFNMQRCAQRTSDFDLVPNVVAMGDGIKTRSKNDEDAVKQNADYTGWKEDVFRDCVFITDPFGKIVDAAVNYPGSFHDSKKALWSKIYDHIKEVPHPYRIAVDSAFSATGDLRGKVVKTKYKFGEESSPAGRQLTHLRQPAEWANHTLTGVCRRLLLELPTDNVTRGYLLWSSIYVTNWRTNTTNRNQIKTYFDYLDQCRAAEAGAEEGGT